jgi:hypothetical protein
MSRRSSLSNRLSIFEKNIAENAKHRNGGGSFLSTVAAKPKSTTIRKKVSRMASDNATVTTVGSNSTVGSFASNPIRCSEGYRRPSHSRAPLVLHDPCMDSADQSDVSSTSAGADLCLVSFSEIEPTSAPSMHSSMSILECLPSDKKLGDTSKVDALNDMSASASCLETVPEVSNRWSDFKPTSRYARRRLSMVSNQQNTSIRSNPLVSGGSDRKRGVPVNKNLDTLMSKLDAVMSSDAEPEKKGRRRSMF